MTAVGKITAVDKITAVGNVRQIDGRISQQNSKLRFVDSRDMLTEIRRRSGASPPRRL